MSPKVAAHLENSVCSFEVVWERIGLALKNVGIRGDGGKNTHRSGLPTVTFSTDGKAGLKIGPVEVSYSANGEKTPTKR
jgi:hypothetical protein